MSNPQDYSRILFEAYEKFILSLGGKRVPTPYRRNEIGSYQKLGAEFQGKSSPETLIKTTKKLAKEQDFILDRATVEEIREFMRQNKLGIDCSGFSHRMLSFLTESIGLGSLETASGLPHVGRTNVSRLTSDEFTVPVPEFDKTRPGDLIKFDSNTDIPHCVIILENAIGKITYAHSCENTNPTGVHTGTIDNGNLPAELAKFSYNTTLGDGIRRLKILSCQSR